MYRAFYLDREFSEAHRDRSFTDYIDRFHAVDADSFTVPPSLAGVLRPYQREGFTWLSTLTELDFGGILADEMGLGKSLQLISLLLSRPEDIGPESPALIICPASLVYNWVAEFATFAPALDVVALEGGKADRARIRRESHDVLVTSYDLARVDVESLERMSFSFCVLDEAQYIKNHATLTTRAIKRIRAERRFALTGTPMENRLSEIWSIFDFLMPGFLGSYARFRERFELGILGGDEELARGCARSSDRSSSGAARARFCPSCPKSSTRSCTCRLPESRAHFTTRPSSGCAKTSTFKRRTPPSARPTARCRKRA